MFVIFSFVYVQCVYSVRLLRSSQGQVRPSTASFESSSCATIAPAWASWSRPAPSCCACATLARRGRQRRGALRAGGGRRPRRLRRATRHEYLLTVQALDGGSPPLSDHATLNISVRDSNENTPAFVQTRYAARVSEDAAPGQRVVQLVVDDTDVGANSRVAYSVARGDRGHFAIDADTGYISVAAALERETEPAYVLEVRANDNPPLGTSVLQFAVTDADAPPNAAPFTFNF